jgi:hypothetical protein
VTDEWIETVRGQQIDYGVAYSQVEFFGAMRDLLLNVETRLALMERRFESLLETNELWDGS